MRQRRILDHLNEQGVPADLLFDAEGLETGYPNMRKFLTAIAEFRAYIASNSASLKRVDQCIIT
ncbi:hypothetical protein [Mesorhizobium sangaii]|uniref:Uncharacterized protein n=1 Tax=Mesorhizobium sangaii TaxID=505389 RepID=A0A841PYF2_9HYPH|nr:hypothetical protein [Mesorhizobium sangaii]MBB6413795.1 hypothetical protein [Mesorhizobium sangaii]